MEELCTIYSRILRIESLQLAGNLLSSITLVGVDNSREST